MSGQVGLAFNRVELRRMPGFSSGFSVADLCNGINIIYGPNASGKSTTARTIHALLWPEDLPSEALRNAFSGALLCDGAEWRIDYDAGYLRRQRDGVDSGPPNIAGPDTRDRYILHLHDLLAADNAEFAQAILRESAGGYDLGKAINQLGYQSRPSQARSERQQVEQSWKRVRETEEEQRKLAGQETRLADLETGREQASQAQRRVRVLEDALKLVEARCIHSAAEDHLGWFPEALERMHGDEDKTLRQIRQQLAGLEDRRRREEQVIHDAETKIQETTLQHVEIPDGLIQSLRSQCRELQSIAEQVSRESAHVESARAKRATARGNIGAGLSDDQLAGLDAGKLKDLANLVSQLEESRLRAGARSDLESWVGQIVTPDDIPVLNQGLSLLNDWLRRAATNTSAGSNDKAQAITYISAAIVIVQAIVLAVVSNPAWLVFVIIGVGLVLIVRQKPRSDATVLTTHAEAEYRKLPLSQPASWSVEQVEALVQQLNTLLAQRYIEADKASRWGDLQERRQQDEREAGDLTAKREQMAQELGFQPPADSANLMILANNIARWQDEERAVRGAEASLATARAKHDNRLRQINQSLAQFGYSGTAGHSQVSGLIDNLEQRINALTDACRTIQAAHRALTEDIEPEIERWSTEHRQFFERLDLEPDDEMTLRQWLDQLDDYRKAKLDLQKAEIELRRAETPLAHDTDLLEAEPAYLETELQTAREMADEYGTINDEIVRINTLIAEAKQKRDLESALAEHQASLEALRDVRERDYRAGAGWVLGEFVLEQTQDRNRPRVFHQAREIFARITHGRYRLEFDDNDPPSFRAVDTQNGVGHGLNELSSATRLQLLMAVRIAFVEVAERGPKLPLLLDETLANSDEIRARAIIDATIEICRSGRQVFYFTAQPDEVGKWIGVLRNHPDIHHATINLAEVRGLSDYERLPAVEVVSTPQAIVPEPNGTSRFAYSEMLKVPGIDPARTNIGAAHLWYLIDDLPTLHRFLTLGITTWGQLQTLIDHGGSVLAGEDQATLLRASARARALEACIDGWRVGRGQPVDRAVLLESNAISEAFIDRVAELAGELDSDAARLLAALESGSVPRFRQTNTAALRTYLTSNGYLSDEEPQTPEQIRTRTLAIVAADLNNGHITPDEIDELLGCIGVQSQAEPVGLQLQ